jgi:predicted RNase H-like HicB family nuclease
VGYVPGFASAHSQRATLDELHANLREVVAMLLEDGDPGSKPSSSARRPSSSVEWPASRSSRRAR